MKLMGFLAVVVMALVMGGCFQGCATHARLGAAVTEALGSDPIPVDAVRCDEEIATAGTDIWILEKKIASLLADTTVAEADKANDLKQWRKEIAYLKRRIRMCNAVKDILVEPVSVPPQ